jgi:hypothetical protein
VRSFMSMVAWLKSECCNVALCRNNKQHPYSEEIKMKIP